MNRGQFNQVTDEFLATIAEIRGAKNKAYSPDGEMNTSSQFSLIGARVGISKYQVLAVFKEKHDITIANAIRNNPEHPVDPTEGLKLRMADSINYSLILHAMLVEDGFIVDLDVGYQEEGYAAS